jgi:4-carboxymuconolactone decarboxylase
MPNDDQRRRGHDGDIAPTFDEITQSMLFGDLWERPPLSKRDRSLITVATLVGPLSHERAASTGLRRDS